MTAAQWITNFLAGNYGTLQTPLEYSPATTVIGTSGVYAIEGPFGVYVGQSWDCWSRGTLAIAVKLGWPCGIIRELPGSDDCERRRVEALIAQLFRDRGFAVVSKNDPVPQNA